MIRESAFVLKQLVSQDVDLLGCCVSECQSDRLGLRCEQSRAAFLARMLIKW